MEFDIKKYHISAKYRKELLGKKVTIKKEHSFLNDDLLKSKEIYVAKVAKNNGDSNANLIYRVKSRENTAGHEQAWNEDDTFSYIVDEKFLMAHKFGLYKSWNVPAGVIGLIINEAQLEFDF